MHPMVPWVQWVLWRVWSQILRLEKFCHHPDAGNDHMYGPCTGKKPPPWLLPPAGYDRVPHLYVQGGISAGSKHLPTFDYHVAQQHWAKTSQPCGAELGGTSLPEPAWVRMLSILPLGLFPLSFAPRSNLVGNAEPQAIPGWTEVLQA